MPRCYMVKKSPSRLEGTPPCSPSEACVVPPRYNLRNHSVAGPRLAQSAQPPRHVGTQYEEPRSGDFAEKSGGQSTSPRGGATTALDTDYIEPRNGIYTVLRAAEYTDLQLSRSIAESHQFNYIDSKPDFTWKTEYDDVQRGDSSEAPNANISESRQADYYDPRQTDYSDPRHAQYSEPRSADYAEPRTVRYLERDLSSCNEPRVAETYSEQRTAGYDESRSANYAEPRSHYDPPRSAEYEPRASEDVAPKASECEEARSAEFAEPRTAEYAELQNMGSMVREHSAADTEAAHELLSLAASVPPLPPVPVLTVLSAPEPIVPVYTYTFQPTNIYIIAEEPAAPSLYTTTLQTLTPLQQVEYTSQPQVNTYITYHEAIGPPPPLHYQQLYSVAEPQLPMVSTSVPLSMPVSVIEAVPGVAPLPITPEPAPLSIQVPVIEPVPISQQNPARAVKQDTLSDSEADEPVATCKKNVKKIKYDCNECGKRYATSSNLSRHKQTHRSLDSQAAKRCGVCGKVYVSMPALAMHILTHRMGHVCGVCGKQFSRPWLLRGHLRSHTGEKPYNCPSCSKSFADRSNLRAHLQTHTADKKWECTRCNKSFALKSYLNKHLEAACSQDEQDSQ